MLSATEILKIWEVGQSQLPAEHALALLAVCCPKATRGELEQMNIGKRDALLLAFRERLFGPHFSGVARCPECNSDLEIVFHAAEVQTAVAPEPTGPFEFTFGDFDFTCRLPNSADLIAVIRQVKSSAVSVALFDRCLLEKRHQGREVASNSLPAEVVEAIVNELARRDPQADIRFALSCPDCAHQWEAIFDIVSFAWNEISAWAARLMRQVHTLALAYGWREIDILTMSSWRRQAYLEMLGE